MYSKLKNIQKTFIASIVGLTVLSVLGLGTVLYATNAIELRQSVSSAKLYDLTNEYPEVAAYLETQKQAEPHFITIANLVKNDQQMLLAKALLFTGIPVLVLSVLLAYFLARKLLVPVEQTFADQERFLQDASHEMRNPLAALFAVVQDAKTSADTEQRHKSLHSIERQVRQLVKLNDDMLLIERSKQKKEKLETINISDLVSDVIDSEYADAAQRQVKIKSAITKGLVPSIEDKDWVCIVRNLIENAIKYSDKKSTVDVTLKSEKQNIIFRVKDNGIGIPESEIAHMGERFYRGKNVGRIKGTGLGLAIVRQLTEKYNYQISITSKENKGTAVIVTAPTR